MLHHTQSCRSRSPLAILLIWISLALALGSCLATSASIPSFVKTQRESLSKRLVFGTPPEGLAKFPYDGAAPGKRWSGRVLISQFLGDPYVDRTGHLVADIPGCMDKAADGSDFDHKGLGIQSHTFNAPTSAGPTLGFLQCQLFWLSAMSDGGVSASYNIMPGGYKDRYALGAWESDGYQLEFRRYGEQNGEAAQRFQIICETTGPIIATSMNFAQDFVGTKCIISVQLADSLLVLAGQSVDEPITVKAFNVTDPLHYWNIVKYDDTGNPAAPPPP